MGDPLEAAPSNNLLYHFRHQDLKLISLITILDGGNVD